MFSRNLHADAVCSDARAVRDQQRRLPPRDERDTVETMALSDEYLMAQLGRVP